MNYPNKQIRLQKYDYSQPGYYFVTICTKDKAEFFGAVRKEVMNFHPAGNIAAETWRLIPGSYHFVKLDEFVIMPNHMHGIIIIEPHDLLTSKNGTPRRAATGLHSLSAGSLPSIVNHYKGAVKKKCNIFLSNFFWQSRFYDHVIRHEESLDKIREYIRNNPMKWEIDKNNPENLWM